MTAFGFDSRGTSPFPALLATDGTAMANGEGKFSSAGRKGSAEPGKGLIEVVGNQLGVRNGVGVAGEDATGSVFGVCAVGEDVG